MLTSYLRAVADASPLIAFRAAAGGLPILVGLFIANRWGIEELAAFTVANAAITVTATIADWGATRALPRNLSSLAAERAASFLASATAWRLTLAALVVVVVAVAAAAGGIDPAIIRYAVVLLPLCPLLVLTTNAISQRVVARELAGIGAGVAAGAAVLVATGAAAVAAGLGPLWLAAAYVVGKLVEAAVIVSGRVWVVRARTGNALATAVLLWPFSLQMILGVIYPRLAIFTVERMTTRAELGVFSVAVALQSALLLVPTSLALLQFPELTRRAMAADLPAVRRILVRYTIASALGVGAGLIVLAVFIAPIARALRVPAQHEWLLLAYSALALLTIFSAMMPFLLQARGLESTAARLSILTLMLGLSLQVAALSRFGLPGILLGAGLSDVSATALFAWAAVRGWSQAKDHAR